MPTSTTQELPQITQLPETYAINLDNINAISLSGEDQAKYLQGQVTCDVNTANKSTLLHGAHCDAKGKTFSVFRFIQRDGKNLLLQPKSSISSSIAELKKFGVFAKVEITETDDLTFIAVAGKSAHDFLQIKFGSVPDSLTPVITHDSTNILYIGGDTSRYILIDTPENIDALLKQFKLPVYNNAIWNLLEIKEGFPLLSENTIGEYVPQMMNVQAIHGISFTKGCYLGQETVARMQYLGKNKRALYALKSSSQLANINILPGDVVEKQLGDNWRKAGDILAHYLADDGTLYVQAVLASDLETTNTLRIKNTPECELALVALPYSLT